MDHEQANSADITEAIVSKAYSGIEQTIFIREYNGASRQHGTAWNVIASTFPQICLEALEKLLYCDWYTSCFVAEPTQAAMWGFYGDSHRGACLKFKTTITSSGCPALTLRRPVGLAGTPASVTPVYKFEPIHLQEIQYAGRYAEIEFFRSLGRLTRRQLTFWFRGPDGAFSATGMDLLHESDAWRKAYWENFHNAVTTKLMDWQHEKEYRATLQIDMDLSERASRKLQYRFEDLQGIIFGIKTSLQDKIAIAHIVQEKCKEAGRKGFELHQAYYARRSGRIATTPWNLVKLG